MVWQLDMPLLSHTMQYEGSWMGLFLLASGCPLSAWAPRWQSLLSCLPQPLTFITCCCLSKLLTPITCYLSLLLPEPAPSLSSTRTNRLSLYAFLPPSPLYSPSLRPVSLTLPDSSLKRRNRTPDRVTIMQNNKPCLLPNYWDSFFMLPPCYHPPCIHSSMYSLYESTNSHLF